MSLCDTGGGVCDITQTDHRATVHAAADHQLATRTMRYLYDVALKTKINKSMPIILPAAVVC